MQFITQIHHIIQQSKISGSSTSFQVLERHRDTLDRCLLHFSIGPLWPKNIVSYNGAWLTWRHPWSTLDPQESTVGATDWCWNPGTIELYRNSYWHRILPISTGTGFSSSLVLWQFSRWKKISSQIWRYDFHWGKSNLDITVWWPDFTRPIMQKLKLARPIAIYLPNATTTRP